MMKINCQRAGQEVGENHPTMNMPENSRQVSGLIAMLTITYMISYITRINYGAVISEMQTATGFSKSLLSMALTGSFVTYGVGQIISGICGDKLSPKKLVMWGLIITVCMNLLIPMCKNPYQMLAVWSINGFAQSFMWPPVVKIMTSVLSQEDYKNAVTKVSWGSSFGTIFVYLVSPLLISAIHWKAVFVFSAALGVVMIFVWNRYACDVSIEKQSKKATEKKGNVLFTPVMLCVMVAIILQGMLRDGVTTWMPSYISETYNMSNEISILTGVILSLFSILCFQLSECLYTKRLRNPLSCAALFFCVGALSALCLSIFTGRSAGASVFMSAVLTGCMHGVNLMLIGMLPHYFQSTGKVSTVSGVLNSCTYIGSAASTYGVALLAESHGWNFTIMTWLAVAVCGAVICDVCIKLWNKYQAIQFEQVLI